MAAIHVAVDMTLASRNPAGSGVYANELVEHLRRREDVALTEVCAPAAGLANTLRWLLSGSRRASVGEQVLHCPAFVAPWRPGVPMVLTVHDTSTLRFPEDHPLEWRAYARFVLPGRARAAARVITGTEFTKSEIVRDLRVRPERVAVTPYGVAERFAGPRRRPPEPGAAPVLLFPGAPTRRKNLDLVLSAMGAAPEGTALKRARLEITGASADGFPQHRQRIASLGLTNRVTWLGKVPAERMPETVAGADVLVYPSLYEGFGFPALEAMLTRTPVVASNAACLPEVLGDGALLVDPHDVKAFASALEAVLTQPQVREGLIDRGRTQVKKYSWTRCADQTVDVYRAVLTGSAR
jgi:glycosyltransferase involved in cell wall biosynthesis